MEAAHYIAMVVAFALGVLAARIYSRVSKTERGNVQVNLKKP